MFENILVCLDGTKFSEAIIPFVAELAMHLRSKIILLRVIIVPSLFARIGKVELEPNQSSEILEGEEEATRYLNNKASELMDKGFDVESVIVEGTVEESIIACAKKYKANLIAFASHSRNNFMKVLVGSTTDYLQRNAGIPVLTINPEARIYQS